MKVIFSHGKESGPWGFKIKRLATIAEQMGCGIESIDYTDLMDPDSRVERLLSVLETQTEPAILVGSSMGGYVSLVASESVEFGGNYVAESTLLGLDICVTFENMVMKNMEISFEYC